MADEPAQQSGGGNADELCMPHTRNLATSSMEAVEADGAAVSILTDDARSRDLLYATDAVAARIDELQFTVGEGPCLEAFKQRVPVSLPDISSRMFPARWPAFSSEVFNELGVHGIFAFPILTGGARLGVLEFYRRHSKADLTSPQYTTAQGFSERLGQAVLDELVDYRWTLEQSHYEHRQGNYQFARADVHTAIGVLSVRLDISIADAGARLRARAYVESRSISSLAHDIVHRRADFTDERAL
ncbi:UNVERIFIED_CONTAM: GAF domain-containing protein [Williamsia faeni]